MGRAKRSRPTKHIERFAKQLIALRTKRSWSQKTLAIKADLTQALVSYLEDGGKEPGWLTIIRLAEAFDVSTDTFR
jgi:transcriptional regulator with XRE-family HTH domain